MTTMLSTKWLRCAKPRFNFVSSQETKQKTRNFGNGGYINKGNKWDGLIQSSLYKDLREYLPPHYRFLPLILQPSFSGLLLG
ncbi:hypothetical protein L6452_35188 [Arctium lappa]|uniref:Uncharacterized protein n=1 Tax=Arctium lappa TaxID=4217 RepID=A0ACB8Y5Q8_ARCLA|nr:hypothetical protein L6452_35188 [Arctium lappa]